jgi:hypothetical protein
MSAGEQSLLTEPSRGFPYSVLANVRIVPGLRPRLLRTRSFPIRRSPVILPLPCRTVCDAVATYMVAPPIMFYFSMYFMDVRRIRVTAPEIQTR